jgi:hypothetical protein
MSRERRGVERQSEPRKSRKYFYEICRKTRTPNSQYELGTRMARFTIASAMVRKSEHILRYLTPFFPKTSQQIWPHLLANAVLAALVAILFLLCANEAQVAWLVLIVATQALAVYCLVECTVEAFSPIAK